MYWFLIIIALTILSFSAALIFGAPTLLTLKKQTKLAIDLLDLKPGQTLLDLGSGDGRILREAARRGINSIGYEINPIMVAYSVIRSWRYRRMIKIYWGNYWNTKWPTVDAIYVFLLQTYMQKLDDKIMQDCKLPMKVASFSFKFPNRQPVKSSKGVIMYVFK